VTTTKLFDITCEFITMNASHSSASILALRFLRNAACADDMKLEVWNCLNMAFLDSLKTCHSPPNDAAAILENVYGILAILTVSLSHQMFTNSASR
jgi:hypothetical protein